MCARRDQLRRPAVRSTDRRANQPGQPGTRPEFVRIVRASVRLQDQACPAIGRLGTDWRPSGGGRARTCRRVALLLARTRSR
jgi:hypothetical protein